jgi:hypothetical protein
MAQPMVSTPVEIEKELKYLFGSNSAARNLHSPDGYDSTDEMMMSKMMMSSISFENSKGQRRTSCKPTQKSKHHSAEGDDERSAVIAEQNNSDDEDADDDLDIRSLGSEHVPPQPRAPPRQQGLGTSASLNMAHLSAEVPSTMFLNGTHFETKFVGEELTMAQKARLRDEGIKRNAEIESKQRERERLKALIEEHGLELASKIEGSRRKREKKKKNLLESVPIYSISGAGSALVPRHQARADAVPLVGITKDCAYQNDWPQAANVSKQYISKTFKGKVVYVRS